MAAFIPGLPNIRQPSSALTGTPATRMAAPRAACPGREAMDRHIGRQFGDSTLPIGSPELLHDLDGDTLGCTSRLHRNYGPIVAFPKGSDLTVFTCGAEAGYTVFSDPEAFHVLGHPGTKNPAHPPLR